MFEMELQFPPLPPMFGMELQFPPYTNESLVIGMKLQFLPKNDLKSILYKTKQNKAKQIKNGITIRIMVINITKNAVNPELQ
jgi:hypothetical protein